MSFRENISNERIALKRRIEAASGRIPAELVLKNATYVNVFTGRTEKGDIAMTDGRIVGIGSYSGDRELDVSGKVVAPGLIDAHIHLESSLAAPSEFARAVLPHGTTTVMADPHEIANVMGADGIRYMLEATEGLPVDVYFMVPSCVPATPFDESGADLEYEDIEEFLTHPRILGLAEMMNYVGTVAGDEKVLDKIAAARLHGMRVDGHSPGLAGRELNAYLAAGVNSDHECADIDDAVYKLSRGMHIMIREGTAAKNLDKLIPIIKLNGGMNCMLCTDDKNSFDLVDSGHIDSSVQRIIKSGADPVVAVKVASRNTAEYFGLHDLGAVAPGYRADLIIVDNLKDFQVESVIKRGKICFEKGRPVYIETPVISERLVEKAQFSFDVKEVTPENFSTAGPLGVIGIVDHEITTLNMGMADGVDTDSDILKIAVLERHMGTGHTGLGYIHGYGLKSGAVASSVSHDSHNIVVVGADDEDMAEAVNLIIRQGGGLVVADRGRIIGNVPLPMAGIMGTDSLAELNAKLEKALEAAKSLGIRDEVAPFMTLAFMALPVIPELRITTHGIFSVTEQKYIKESR